MNNLNYEKVFKTLVEETKNYLVSNNLKAMILGISGGIDSTIVSAICHEVSKQTGIPFIGRSLPIKNQHDEFSISELVGETFCTDFCDCNLYFLFDELNHGFKMFEYNHSLQAYVHSKNYGVTPIMEGNIQARLRMIYLYNLASFHKGIVMSTDNQTEYQLGFWTIHGDVGDFNPLFGLWKTEVYGLARWLVIHYQDIAEYPEADCWENRAWRAIAASMRLTPTDGLGISNSDLDQIGAKSYEEVDDILNTLLNGSKKGKFTDEAWIELKEKYGTEVLNKIWERHEASEFKRKSSPVVITRGTYL